MATQTPGTAQRPPPQTILRMSLARAERAQRVAEAQQQTEPSESKQAVRNTPTTIRKVPLNKQSDFRLPPLPVDEGQHIVGQDIVLETGDPYAFMVRIGLIQDQRNQSIPILYYSPDRALVTNIRMDRFGFSPISVSYTHLTLPTSDLV